jgi:hypothetical protein
MNLSFPWRGQRPRSEVYYHPQVVGLEDRLPPGQTLLGLTLLSAWLDVPAEAMLDPVLARAERHPGQGLAPILPAFADTASNAVTSTVSPPSFPEAPQMSHDQAGPSVSTTALSDSSSVAGQVLTAISRRIPSGRVAAGGAFAPVGSAPVVSFAGTRGLANGFLPPAAYPHKASGPPQAPALASDPSGAVPAATDLGSANRAQIQENFGRLPLSFEANVGQAGAQVQFLAHGPGYSLYLTSDEAEMVLGSEQQSTASSQQSGPESLAGAADIQSTVVRMQVLGGKAGVQAVGEQQMPGIVNYFLGNDPSQWRTHLATYGRVTYPDIYPGIALAYYSNQQQLEYDFVVAPGADPTQIRLGFSGADQVALDAQGDLVLGVGGQEIHQHKPFVYQDVNGARREIPSAFVVTNSSPIGGEGSVSGVGFALGVYDPSRPLVIDPVLSYSTYLGGNSEDRGFGIAVDAEGNTYVTGWTSSSDFPTTAGVYQPANQGNPNVFVTKVAADGSTLLYSTYLGGSRSDYGNAIAVDGDGNVYVTGDTLSRDFPTVNALQPVFAGIADAFVTKIAADGSALLYSTYLGGTDYNDGLGIAVDEAGRAYVTGYTAAADFPTANALQPTYGGTQGNNQQSNAFVAKLAADGSALLYSTYLGGSGRDSGLGIAVDGDGNAYVTGETSSTDFPTANPFQPTKGGPSGYSNGFVAKVAADGSALLYSTYLGGSGGDQASSIAVDGEGNAYVTGYTFSSDFPTANAFQPRLQGFANAFVTKVAADDSALLYSTYLGGSGADAGLSIALDGDGNAYVTGHTNSHNFPTANALQPALGGPIATNAFVTKVAADGSTLLYSTYLGGSHGDEGHGIAVDGFGNAYVMGYTDSRDFPTANALQALPGGNGIFKSTSAGDEWGGSNTGLTNGDVRALVLDPTNPSTAYAGTNGSGVFVSSDAGLSWSPSNAGLTNLSIRALAIDPVLPSVLYAGTDGGGVFQSADGGATWNPSNTGLTDLSIRAIVIDPATPATLYAATAANGGVFKSTDGGATWNLSNAGLENAQVVSVAVDSSAPSVLYAGTNYYGVDKSTDGGASWSPSNTGLPLGIDGGRNITALAINPVTPTTLYTGVSYSVSGYPSTQYRVYKSTDGGATWINSSTGLPLLRTVFNSLAVDPVTPTTVFVGSSGGLYKSLNGGATWSRSGLTTVQALAIDPTDPATVYAGTVSAGSDAFVTKIGLDS